nr:hypothetical protein [Acidimicrobiales bacterium]
GTLVAGVAGYASIRWLLKMLTSHTLWPFVVYRLVLAGLLAALLLGGWQAGERASGAADERNLPAPAALNPL